MAPPAMSTKEFQAPRAEAADHNEKPLTDEKLQELLSALPPSCLEQQSHRRETKNGEDLDWWLDACSVSSYNDEYRPEQNTREQNNEIFLYNFWRRRQSWEKAEEYLKKIESRKADKMRNLVSEIRKLELQYIMLPIEKVDPREAQLRRTKESQARTEAQKMKVAEANARRIMSIITGNE